MSATATSNRTHLTSALFDQDSRLGSGCWALILPHAPILVRSCHLSQHSSYYTTSDPFPVRMPSSSPPIADPTWGGQEHKCHLLMFSACSDFGLARNPRDKIIESRQHNEPNCFDKWCLCSLFSGPSATLFPARDYFTPECHIQNPHDFMLHEF